MINLLETNLPVRRLQIAARPDADLIKAQLQPGEPVLWLGRADPAISRRRRRPRLLIAAAFGGFGLLWITKALGLAGDGRTAAGWTMAVAGAAFAGFALVRLLGRKARAAEAPLLYAVTDRRVLVLALVPGAAPMVTSFGPADIGAIARSERPDGRGDVIFGERIDEVWVQTSAQDQRHGRSPERRQIRSPIGLFGIEQPRRAEALLLQLKDGGGGR